MLQRRASSAYSGLTHSCRSFYQRGSATSLAAEAPEFQPPLPPPTPRLQLQLQKVPSTTAAAPTRYPPAPVPVPAQVPARTTPTATLTADAAPNPKLLPLPLHTFTSTDIYSPTAARNYSRDLLITSAAIRHRKTATLRATRQYFASRPFSTSRTTSATAAATMSSQGEWTGVKVRQTFFDFFAERGHTIGKYASRAPAPAPAPPTAHTTIRMAF